MQQAFNGMSRRTTFESNMELAVVNLKASYPHFESEFRQFFPELQLFVSNNFDISA
jgi:acyl carrier protein phosphodiesterase